MMDPKMIEEVSAIAAKAAIEHLEAERKRQQKAKRDRRLRNTRLLLRHYRTMKEHCDDTPLALKNNEIETITVDIDAEYLAINSITRSKKRTKQMIEFVDRMLELYRVSAEKSENPSHLRQYKAMHAMYIEEEPLTVSEISKSSFVDERTVYRDVKEAVYQLSCLIFGVDGLRFIE